ncbi:MAG: uroporphyrinogen-III synthase [Caulobacteraceae bacterium]|nr:uroporphyrinogen-III synthase [Caulobacteraceae bacterium]
MARRAGSQRTPRPAPRPARTIWITRTEPGAAATAERVRSLGLEAVIAPLLAVRALETPIGLEGVSAIAFTSANAVRAFAERSQAREARVFAVGEATAAAARAAGFSSVVSAGGDVKALVALLAGRRRELGGVILNPTAAQPAADIAGALAAIGLRVRPAPLYETVETEPSPALLERLPEIDHVLLHSARGSRALARLLKRHPAPHLAALALSRQVASPIGRSRLAAIRIAAAPEEAALLALLDEDRSG